MIPTGTWFLEILGGEGRALEQAEIYLNVSLIGLPFLLLALAGAGSYTGRQDTRTPLLLALAGAVANLVLELVLINGFGYGIGASALATVIAQVGVGVVFAAGPSAVGSAPLGVGLRPDGRALVKLDVAGRALVIRAVALRGSFTLAAAAAARIGVAGTGGPPGGPADLGHLEPWPSMRWPSPARPSPDAGSGPATPSGPARPPAA